MTDEKRAPITPQVAIKAKALQASGEEFEVRRYIPTAWDEDGDEDMYKQLEECTVEELHAFVEHELQRASAIEDEVAAIVVYTGGFGPRTDDA